jgi:hypothetical protein
LFGSAPPFLLDEPIAFFPPAEITDARPAHGLGSIQSADDDLLLEQYLQHAVQLLEQCEIFVNATSGRNYNMVSVRLGIKVFVWGIELASLVPGKLAAGWVGL